nr:hypothetical protein [Rhizobium laguerreae]
MRFRPQQPHSGLHHLALRQGRHGRSSASSPRYDLAVLPGVIARDKALRNNDRPPMGDLTAALDLSH